MLASSDSLAPDIMAPDMLRPDIMALLKLAPCMAIMTDGPWLRSGAKINSRIWRKPCLPSPKSSCRLKYSDLFWEINSDQRKSILTKKEPKRACCATRELSIKKHFSDCINLWMWQRIKGGTLLNLVIFPPKCYFLLSWEITTEKSLSLTDISIKTWLTSKLSKNQHSLGLLSYILQSGHKNEISQFSLPGGVKVHIMIPRWIYFWCFKVGWGIIVILRGGEEGWKVCASKPRPRYNQTLPTWGSITNDSFKAAPK